MFKCNECEYISRKYFGLCPSCGEGIGEEIEDAFVPKKTRSGSKSAKEIKTYRIEKADDNIQEDEVIKKTGFEDFDKVISTGGGFVKEQIIALGAQPGVGKSTLCAQLCDENSLYISSEESINQVKSRFKRVNPGSNASIVSETDLDTIVHIIETTDKDFIIIDSLNSINNGVEGYVRQAANLTLITSVMKSHGKTGIIINQVTKSGGITGMNTVLHTVDTVLYLEKSPVSDLIVLWSTKNRFGAIGSVAVFEHRQNGLHETSRTDKEDLTDRTGVTFTKARFGHKNMDIMIEALVAPSSMNYGLRRSYGLNQARVQQIIGVLSSNSNIDFSNRDVYVSVQNGLNVTDTSIDLAVANSILSSLFQKESVFDSLSGTLSLNGTVRNSDSGIKHIKELIQMYRGGY